MSGFQKQQRPGATPIRNPLLSASVTGLTFDDFPNKPLLLPAAPPTVRSPAPGACLTSSGLLAREPKSLVTVGSSSLDTENLDEINLNSSNEDNQTSEASDLNSNPLLEPTSQGPNSDSILSQAASSFSALPSVASNVFSTFSKRITAISSRETTPVNEEYQQDNNSNTLAPQIDVQPTYIQQSQPVDLPQAPPTSYAPPLSSNFISSDSTPQTNVVTPEPPKFYTPAEVPSVPLISTGPPPASGGQNNFRFSSKKKVYAPIPGLSDQSQIPKTTLDPASVSGPILFDTSNQYFAPTQQAEDRKSSPGIFSKITNLAPSGVLQNITGLVQTAAESLTQTNKSDNYQETHKFPQPVLDQQNNYFATAPPPTNYFVPQQQTETASLTIQDPSSAQIKQPSPALSGPPETGFQPLHSTTPPNSSQVTVVEQPSTAPITFFNPSKYLPPASQTSATTQTISTPSSVPTTSAYKIPPPSSGPTSYRLQKGTKLYKNPLTPQETVPIQVAPNQIQQTTASSQTFPLFTPPPVGVQGLVQNLNVTEPPPISSQSSATSSFSFPPPPVGVGTESHSLSFNPFVSSQPTGATQASLTSYAPTTSLTTQQDNTLFAAAIKNQNSNEALQIAPSTPSSSLSVPPQSNQGIDVLTTEIAKSETNETVQTVPLYYPTGSSLLNVEKHQKEQEQEVKTDKPATCSLAPPLKKIKSDQPDIEQLAKEDSLTKEESQKISHIEREDPLETFEKHFLAQVPKQDTQSNIYEDTETQPIFKPIEPVFEPNITAVQKEKSADPLEETLQKLSLTAPTEQTNALKLPPIGESFSIKNPYRRGSRTETSKPAPILPTLANFFTPAPTVAGSGDLNFFSSIPSASSSNEVNFFSETAQVKEANKENSEKLKSQQTDSTNFFTKPFTSELAPVEPETCVHPPISAFFPSGSVPAILEGARALKDNLLTPFDQENLPPPIGFENIKQTQSVTVLEPDNRAEPQQETTTQPQQPEIVNRFSTYFNQTNQQPEIAKDPSTFFDSFHGQQQQLDGPINSSVATNEEQRIQYFFNNPPPKDASHVGDLNYDLVHSGLSIKNLKQRSLTPISNLVEPPSSACSEFSEFNNSTAGQKSFAASSSITEVNDKSIEIAESNKRVTELPDSSTAEDNVKHYEDLSEEILKELRMANLLTGDKTSTSPVASVSYKPAVKHWFFKRTVNDKQIWVPFSHYDSALLETSLLMEGDESSNVVAVEGGRYDVNISERKKMSVYWESPPIEVRRCSWFYKASDSKYVPYEEQIAEVLENEYKQAAESGVWHKTIVLGMGEQVVFHGPTVIVHFQQQQNTDAWGGTTQTATRPRVVKRDLDDFNIEQGESQKVDHLLFMVHGIGSACDLKLRTVEEVVEDFRTIARQLVQSHYKNSTDLGLVGRVEVLPISWHSHLHSAEMGIDEKLRMITLESIPKLRNFTNDTLLDILFYTSPIFCQKIMNTIVSSLNSLYLKYRERHPEFNGGVSLAGHSLGSLILFDLLCHQNPIKESEEKNLENPDQFVAQMDSNQLEDKQMSYMMGPAGTGQPFIHYNQLIFQPKKFFALGSPIGMFVTIRGIDKLGLDFRLPTCPGFYNIFHPYDPVAYRIEALVNPDLSGVRPVLIPHHKGRKRMHLELKETMTRVTMDLKNRFLDKFKTTLDSVNIFGSTSKSTKEAEELMEKEVDKVIQMQIQLEQQNSKENLPSGGETESIIVPRQRTDSVSTAMSDDAVEIDFPLGKLNDSKRIDYVLQEAPLEFINEYIFALSSHVCYWDSEDTILFVMKEIYSGLGISPDSQVPQQTMTIERPSSRNSLIS